MKGKFFMKCCVKYNIKEDEVRNWIHENVNDKNDPIYKWDMKQIQEYVEYDRWKMIINDVKSTRTRRYKERMEDEKKFKNPDLDAAISKMTDAELEPM